MKKSFYYLISAVGIISFVTVAFYIKDKAFTHTDVAIAVATILGLSLTAIGTTIGIFAIIKSHDVALKQNELQEKELNQKLAHEIYINLLTPLQCVLNDIQILGDSIFEIGTRQSDASGNVIIPEHIQPQMDEHANVFYAKLNMLILYANKSNYEDCFGKAKELSKSIKEIIKSYNERTWKRETSESLLEAKKIANTLYTDIIDIIRQLDCKKLQ